VRSSAEQARARRAPGSHRSRRGLRWLTALVVVVIVGIGGLCLVAPARAQESGERAAFYAALARAQAGDAAGAHTALLALVARAPGDPFADDALIEAARLDDEVLGQPARAAELYERLVASYPESRLTLRAARRARALRAAMGPGGRDAPALARWQDILMHDPARGARSSIALAHQLLAEVPAFGQAPEVHLWLAERLAQEGETGRALVELAAIPGQEGVTLRRARRLEAELAAAAGHFARARALLGQLVATTPAGDAAQRAALAEALTALDHDELTFATAVVAWSLLALLALLALWQLRRQRQALWPPPTVTLFVLPLSGLFVGAGLTENPMFGHAILALGSATVVVSWLVGAGLERSTRPLAILTWGGLGTLAMLACTYLTIYHLDLYDLVAHTFAFGPE
jgi:hypothetical protein